MTQYPNEKDPHPNWISPQQDPYTSRDGAPPPPPEGSYVSSSQYQAPPGPPPEGYYPPPHQAPPPAYEYPQSQHPQGRKAPPQETYFSPPANLDPYGAPVEAGPPSSSSAPQENQGGIMMSIGAFFGNKGPPPMWSRQPPGHLPYGAFPPMCLISNGSDLSKGFPELPPPCQLNPHPFATHDVAEEDWKRFLADVKRAASLSPAQRIRSNVIPAVTGMSFFTGFAATFAIEKKMKHKNRQAAGDVVDHWNHYFFGPRRVEVVLCQASERLSGRLGAAPVADPNQTRMANGLRQRTDDSSDDDSSEDDGRGHGHGQGHCHGQGHAVMSDRQARRAARRERRDGRREKRAERRERKARGETKEPYQLFVTVV